MSPTMQRLRVICVDDSLAVSSVVARAISREPDMQVVGVLDRADHLVDEATARGTDTIVLDIVMEGASPLDAIRQLKKSCPTCRIIAYSAYDDPATIKAVLEAGATRFISKYANFAVLLSALRERSQTETAAMTQQVGQSLGR